MTGKQSALVILSCCAALVASDASAQSSCSKIADDKERLACFDIGASVEHKAAPAPPASPRRGNKELARGLRAAYANQLRRSFLSNGFSMHVSTYEKNDKKLEDAFTEYRKLYPRLVFTGYLSDSLVFQIAGKGEVLKNAAALGFAGVQFISQGEVSQVAFVSSNNLPATRLVIHVVALRSFAGAPSQNFYEILKTRMSVDLWAMASFDVYQSTVAVIVHYPAGWSGHISRLPSVLSEDIHIFFSLFGE